MAQQAKKKRRKKHRGTQGGSIDRRPVRGRPRTREEAKARARSRQGSKRKSVKTVDRRDAIPTWSSAFKRGLLGAAVFFVLLVLAFKQPVGGALALSVVMVGMYVPLGYYVDRFFYQRRLRSQMKARQEQRAARGR